MVGQAEQCQAPVDRASVNDDEEEAPSLLAQAAVAVDDAMRAGAVHEVKLGQVEDERPAVVIVVAQGALELWDRGDVELAEERREGDRSGVATFMGQAQHAARVGVGYDGLDDGAS